MTNFLPRRQAHRRKVLKEAQESLAMPAFFEENVTNKYTTVNRIRSTEVHRPQSFGLTDIWEDM